MNKDTFAGWCALYLHSLRRMAARTLQALLLVGSLWLLGTVGGLVAAEEDASTATEAMSAPAAVEADAGTTEGMSAPAEEAAVEADAGATEGMSAPAEEAAVGADAGTTEGMSAPAEEAAVEADAGATEGMSAPVEVDAVEVDAAVTDESAATEVEIARAEKERIETDNQAVKNQERADKEAVKATKQVAKEQERAARRAAKEQQRAAKKAARKREEAARMAEKERQLDPEKLAEFRQKRAVKAAKQREQEAKRAAKLREQEARQREKDAQRAAKLREKEAKLTARQRGKVAKQAGKSVKSDKKTILESKRAAKEARQYEKEARKLAKKAAKGSVEREEDSGKLAKRAAKDARNRERAARNATERAAKQAVRDAERREKDATDAIKDQALTAAIAERAKARAEYVYIEEIVIVGTRKADRTVFETVAPVDVIGTSELVNRGTSDIKEALRGTLPSFGVERQAIADGATFLRPPTLRGLPPDQTLVLVNGKRRHRSAVISTASDSVLTKGAQPADLAMIPTIAIDQLQVLRDSASAQYGSDAIAGVMNFALRTDDSGGEVRIKYGQYPRGSDGESVLVQANGGLPLGESGFINASLEVGSSGETSRGKQHPAALALTSGATAAAGDGTNVSGIKNPVQNWGNPELEGLKVFFNIGYPLSASKEFYSFGNIASIDVDGSFFWRNPETNSVFTGADNLRLCGATDRPACPPGTTDSTFADLNYRTLYPSGYTPRFFGAMQDESVLVGLKGQWQTWDYDLSVSYGVNEIEYKLKNTVNPSLGITSQSSFKLGTLEQSETNATIDIQKQMAVGATTVNLAYGFEWRNEKYGIEAGENASWDYLKDSNGDPRYPGLPIGSHGFPGFSPQVAGSWDRENIAVYADFEFDTEVALVLAALRYEDFQDFGDTLNYKFGANMPVSESLSWRATLGSGFRAPTPGQTNLTNVATAFESTSGTSVLVQSLTLPATHAAAGHFGGSRLEPEVSETITTGLSYLPESGGVFTLDYYRISVSDRIGLTDDFQTSAEIKTMFGLANDVSQINFYTNAFDTTTTGLDMVYQNTLSDRADLTLAWNWNSTNVTSTGGILSDEFKNDLEEQLPHERASATLDYDFGRFQMRSRANFYGQWTDYESDDRQIYSQTYGDEKTLSAGNLLVDVAFYYQLPGERGIRFTAGADNLFNRYPPEMTGRFLEAGAGRIYSNTTPYSMNGRFVYLAVSTVF